MSDPIIWTITDDDAQAAEQSEFDEALEDVKSHAETLADVIAAFYGPLRQQLPPKLADTIALEYARLLLWRGAGNIEYRTSEDNGCDWCELD